MTHASPHHTVPALVFAAALALFTLTAGGSLSSTDAVVTFHLTRSLVEDRSIALSENVLGLQRNRGVDGRYYSQYGLGQSVYNIPFYVAGTRAARLAGPVGKPDAIPKAAVALGSAFAAAAAVCLIWWLAFQIAGHARAALIAAASAALASPLWPYSKFGFSAPLVTALLVAAACLLWRAAARGTTLHPACAGGILAFGWLTRHEIALVLIPFTAWLVIEGRRHNRSAPLIVRQVAALVGTAATGGILWMLYNVVRFGSPLEVGYGPRFGVAGYAAYLVAPGASILLFAPIAILWIAGLVRARRTSPALLLLLAGPLVVSYLFYGALDDWAGGRSYGPRYLVPTLLLLSPGAALLWSTSTTPGSRARVMAIVALAAVLQLPGVLVDYSKVSLDWARSATPQQITQRNWRIESSSLLLNAKEAVRRVPENVRYLSGRASPPPVRRDLDRDFAQQFSFSLDFWWLYLHYMGALAAPVASLVALVLLAAAIGFATAAWRLAGRLPPLPDDEQSGRVAIGR